jgi:hypothetical protein
MDHPDADGSVFSADPANNKRPAGTAGAWEIAVSRPDITKGVLLWRGNPEYPVLVIHAALL